MWEISTSPKSILAIVCLLIILAVFLYFPTVNTLLHIWIFSDFVTYKHGLLLLAVGGYLFYQNWAAMGERVAIQLDPVGLSFLVMASIIWFFGMLAEVQVVQQFIFIFIIYFMLWALLGYHVSRRLAFPVLLLLCATPIWSLINEDTLQLIIAKVVTFFLKLSGVHSFREEVRILIPEGTFSVNPECSGMQQLIAAVSVAVIYAHLNKFKLTSFFIYIVLAMILSMMLNMVRIFIVVMSGHLTNMQHYFIQVEHNNLGWVLFGVGIFIFMLATNKFLMTRYGQAVVREDNTSFDNGTNHAVPSGKSRAAHVTLVVIALSVGPVWSHIQNSKTSPEIGNLVISEKIIQWRYSSEIESDYRPFFITGDRVYEGNFRNPQNQDVVFCYIGYYHDQKQGKELISDYNNVYDTKTWMKMSSTKYDVEIKDENFVVNETVVRTPQGKEKLIWHWYYLSGAQTSNAKVAKLLEIWGELSNQPGATLFLLATDIRENYDESRKTLNSFINDAIFEMHTAIGQLHEKSATEQTHE